MPQPSKNASVNDLTAYVVELEVEVDRLRQHNRRLQEEIQKRLTAAQAASTGDGGLRTAVAEVIEMVDEMRQMPDDNPADDQVVAIAFRPLAEQIIRYYRRWCKADQVTFSLHLESETINWFPSRLRHILENLISNCFQYVDSGKSEMRVSLQLGVADSEWLAIRFEDNGVGMDVGQLDRAADLQSRAGTRRYSRPEVGLAVVKRLVEQSGGAFTIRSAAGSGTAIDIVLPRFNLDDFLT